MTLSTFNAILGPLTLVLAITFTVQAVRWIRALVKADTEISDELRLIIEDLRSRDPQLEDVLELSLHKLDDWERRMQRLRHLTLLTLVRRKP
jgi:hypothetical protein